MRVLIAEDDIAGRKYLHKLMEKYGECDIVIDGLEALDAYLISIKQGNPYDLICMDIMMPKVDGIKVLKAIRDFERQKKMHSDKCVKVIITTSLAHTQFVRDAFDIGCEAYAAKPIDADKFIKTLKELKLIEN